MIWREHLTIEDGKVIYAKVEDDGKIRLTAEIGHPELDAYLAWVAEGKKPEDFWKAGI